MTEWVLPLLTFCAVALPAFVVARLFLGRDQTPEGRFPTPDEEPLDPDAEVDLGGWTQALAEQLPVAEERQAELRPELREAGFYSAEAMVRYAAIRAALILIPLLGCLALAAVAPLQRIPVVLGGGLALALLGYSLPRVYVNYRARVRKRQIEQGLPVAVDLLTLGLSGGQSVMGALERVSREIAFSYPVLAEELDIVRHQAQLGSMRHALRQLSDRVRVPEVRNLVVILTQSEQLGMDIVTGLEEFATSFRTTLRQRADAQANRMSFMMMFPTLLGLWIPAAIILIAPMFFEFTKRRTQTRDLVQQRQRQGGEDAFQRIASPISRDRFAAPPRPEGQ